MRRRWHSGAAPAIAVTLEELGVLAQQEGDATQAHSLFQEALTLRRELGDRAGVATSLAHLGNLASVQGDHERAVLLYKEVLDLLRTIGDRAATAVCLEGLATVSVAEGRLDRATRLHGAAATLRWGTFVLNVWDEGVARDRQIAAVRAALGDEVFAAAWAEGQAMTLEQAIAYAMDGVEG
jgi:tetratricopeptide (TPR) repeat protein